MSRKVTEFITEIAAHFPPRHPDEATAKAWTESMFRELGGYEAEVLTNAARSILRKRKADRYRIFPTLGECIAACNDAIEWLRRSKAPLLPVASGEGADWSADRIKLAYDLMRTGLGRQASKEGWNVSYWHFCRRNMRAPDKPHEIEQCRRDSAGIEDIQKRALNGECGPASQALAKWAGDILNKRIELSNVAHGLGR